MRKKLFGLTDRTWWMAWALLALMSFATLIPIYYDQIRFWWTPVTKMQGEEISRTGTGVVLHIYGKKIRGEECRWIEFQAFGDRYAGLPIDLYMLKADILPNDGKTKPKGSYDLGLWSLYPTDPVLVYQVRVNVTHNCDGTIWSTEIAKVALRTKGTKHD